MFKTINLLRALFAAAFLLFIGNAMMLSSNAIILHEMGFSDFAIGNVGAAIYAGALASTLSASYVVNKVGHIRAYGCFISIYALTSLVHIYVSDIYVWGVLRFVLGYCYYGLLVVIETWINNKAKNENRSRIIAVYEVIFYAGFCVGTLLLALNLSAKNVFIFSAFALLLASIPLNLLKIKQPQLSRHKQRMKLPDVFSVSPLALVAAFIGGFCINGYYSMSQVFYLAKGYDASKVSLFITCTMAGGFFAQSFIGKISDYFGRKLAILGCSFLGLIACVAMLLAPSALWLQLGCFMLGCGVFCIYALALARASDRIKDAAQLLEVGRTLLFAYSLSSVISPVILGAAVNLLGANAFIYIYIIALLCLIAFAFTQPKIDASKRSRFKKRPGFFAVMRSHE